MSDLFVCMASISLGVMGGVNSASLCDAELHCMDESEGGGILAISPRQLANQGIRLTPKRVAPVAVIPLPQHYQHP